MAGLEMAGWEIAGLELPVLAALALLGLAGGIGITALGPGGVLPTIGLFALTDLSPTVVAGTAIVTHVATGLLATGAYARSGELREPATLRLAGLIAATAVVGTPLGVQLNTLVSARAFGVLLAVLLVLVAALVRYRDRRAPDGGTPDGGSTRPPATPSVLALGLGVSVASGVLGIGGPMLAVPLLIAASVPVLSALAAAQAQSIVIATAGSVGYLAHGGIDWGLAALVGVPELAGVLIGWVVARKLPTRVLKHALVLALLVVAPYLALHG
ncbi:sulfite exporter TauE/SafE family protein [Bounagaea algeriensis]